MMRRTERSSDKQRRPGGDLEEGDGHQDTTAVITIQRRTPKNGDDQDDDDCGDSISAMSDPSAFWQTPAAYTHSMLGGGEMDNDDDIAEEAQAYHHHPRVHVHAGAYETKKQRQPHQPPPNQKHQKPHGLRNVRSTVSTPSTALSMDEVAIDSALQKAFQEQNEDQRKVIHATSFHDPDFWSIDGKGQPHKGDGGGFCRNHFRLICLLITVALVGTGVALGLILTRSSRQPEGSSKSTPSSVGTTTTTTTTTSAPTSLASPVTTPAPSDALAPTVEDVTAPVASPFASPVFAGTQSPSEAAATLAPTGNPTLAPSTSAPTQPDATIAPTAKPTTPMPTLAPSSSPVSPAPTSSPSLQPVVVVVATPSPTVVAAAVTSAPTSIPAVADNAAAPNVELSGADEDGNDNDAPVGTSAKAACLQTCSQCDCGCLVHCDCFTRGGGPPPLGTVNCSLVEDRLALDACLQDTCPLFPATDQCEAFCGIAATCEDQCDALFLDIGA